jgi:hypothetical protein
VRILDAQNRLVAVYNLTTYDLSVARNRETLKQLFLSAARFIDTDGDGLLDDWEILNFGNLSAGPDDDPDGDGQDNFTEYAFGTNPKDANSRTSFRPSLSGTGSNQTFSVSFRRRAGSCIEYFLEGSMDLSQWSASTGTVTMNESFRNLFDGTGTGRATCSLTAPVPSQTQNFLRVRATPKSVISHQ